MSATYQQPVLPIADPQIFGAVKSAIEFSFSSGHVADFLKSLERSKLRIRDFETVLGKGEHLGTGHSRDVGISNPRRCRHGIVNPPESGLTRTDP